MADKKVRYINLNNQILKLGGDGILSYTDVATMVAEPVSNLQDGTIAWVSAADQHKYYQYLSENELTETGKWRELFIDPKIQIKEVPVPSAELNGTIIQYIGETNASYKRGYFYECVFANEGYVHASVTLDTRGDYYTKDADGNYNLIQLDGTNYDASETYYQKVSAVSRWDEISTQSTIKIDDTTASNTTTYSSDKIEELVSSCGLYLQVTKINTLAEYRVIKFPLKSGIVRIVDDYGNILELSGTTNPNSICVGCDILISRRYPASTTQFIRSMNGYDENYSYVELSANSSYTVYGVSASEIEFLTSYSPDSYTMYFEYIVPCASPYSSYDGVTDKKYLTYTAKESDELFAQIDDTQASDTTTYSSSALDTKFQKTSYVVDITKAEYDALDTKDENTYYIISDDNIDKNLNATPVGSVISFAGINAPTGYLMCNGSEVSRTDYYELFSVIGTLYGEGDGSTTFNLPNLQDKFIEGSGINAVGTEMSAGLPNITAYLNMPTSVGRGGAFYSTTYSGGLEKFDMAGNETSNAVGFDASRSSSVYGNSTTVQPPAVVMNYIIKY